MNIKYPLEATGTGDLALCQTLEDDAASRVQLIANCVPGDREMFPTFGNQSHVFEVAISDAVEAVGLQDSLNRFGTVGGDIVYTVRPSERSTHRHPDLDVFWSIRTDQDTPIEGGLNIGTR